MSGPDSAPVLGVAVHQFSPRLRAIDDNLERIAATAAAVPASLVVTPELGVTGYGIGDDAADLACRLVPEQPPSAPCALAASIFAGRADQDVVLGIVDRGRRGLPYNAAAVLRDGRVRHVHRKIHLPTYGMFDEARFFAAGDRLSVFELGGGWRCALLICEDFWHPGLTYVLAAAGIDVLIVPAAAPGRGVWEGSASGGRFRSNDAWEQIARATALVYGIYVLYANRVGVEAGVTFGGGSLIAGPGGHIIARADDASEAVLTAELRATELARGRRPYAHGRDDDPRLVHRELARLVL